MDLPWFRPPHRRDGVRTTAAIAGTDNCERHLGRILGDEKEAVSASAELTRCPDVQLVARTITTGSRQADGPQPSTAWSRRRTQ